MSDEVKIINDMYPVIKKIILLLPDAKKNKKINVLKNIVYKYSYLNAYKLC